MTSTLTGDLPDSACDHMKGCHLTPLNHVWLCIFREFLVARLQLANGEHYGALAQLSPAREQGRAKFNFSLVPPAGLEPTA